jgi:hypothetical protein
VSGAFLKRAAPSQGTILTVVVEVSPRLSRETNVFVSRRIANLS